MGLLRLILALNVVIAHSGTLFKLVSVGGMIAVEVFFMISGFYMSLILNEKYATQKNAYSLFMSNRLLRLFPTYFLVLLLTVLFSILTLKFFNNGFELSFFLENIKHLNIFSFIFLIFSTIFILGQDLFLFTTLNESTSSLIFSSNFLAEKFQMYKFLFIPQAWTLSLELMFYFMAPFLVKRKSPILLLIIFLSLGARIWAYAHGLNSDAWLYRFFPFEIMFFLLGILSYKIYKKYENSKIPLNIKIIIPVVLLSYIILFQYIPVEFYIKQWFLYLVMIFAIPFLFIITKSMKLDRELGELSYPVYISHILIISALSLFFTGEKPKYFCLLAIIFSIAFSVLIIKLLINPIEKFRQARLKAKSEKTEPGLTGNFELETQNG